MPIFDRYVLGRLAGSFCFFLLVITGVIWLGLSLKLVEIVVNNAQSVGVFLELAALLVPKVLVIVLPLTGFAAALYVGNRLAGDSEIAAITAAGMSGPRLLRPVAVFGVALCLVTLGLALLVAPVSQRQLKTRIAQVKGDVAAAFLREGVFESPARGVTVYLRRLGRPGEMMGIFVHDERDPDETATYTAQRAVLVNEGEGTRLVMFDGIVQLRRAADPATLSLLRFDQLVFDLGAMAARVGVRLPKPSELPLEMLLTIRPPETAGRPVGAYRAEAHERLAGPLYALALPLLAFALMIGAELRRQSDFGAVIMATVAALALRLGGLAVKEAMAGMPYLWPLMYLVPLAGLALAWWLAAGGRPRRRHEEGGAWA